MQALQVFNFKGAEVRTVVIDGQPWWVANDVATVLGLKGRSWRDRLLSSEKGSRLMDTPGGMQHVTVINETGLYKAIMRSDKEQAQAFQHWLASEVLPSIRKTGGYAAPGMGGSFEEIMAELRSLKAQQAAAIDPRALIAGAIASKLELLSPSVQKIVVSQALALPPEVQSIWTATMISTDLSGMGIIASPQKVGKVAIAHGIQCPLAEQENEWGYWAETAKEINGAAKIFPQFQYRKAARDRIIAILTAAHAGAVS